MRTQNKNRQKIYISNQTGMTPVYEYDEDGNLKYITVDGKTVPVTTGEYEMGYSYPVECKANIALSGGEVSNVEFGIDFSAYDAVLEGIDKIDDLLLIIGPEGGISESELELARSAGAVPVSLGRRILRAETAGLVAMSAIFYETGDLGEY